MEQQKPLTEKQKYWLEQVQLAHQSGLPLAQYAREHDLNAHSLWNWSSKFKHAGLVAKEDPGSFVQVLSVAPVSQSTVLPTSTSIAQIRLSNGVEVQVPYRSEDLLVLLTQVSAL